MLAISHFVRNTSPDSLQAYLMNQNINVDGINWKGDVSNDIAGPVLTIVENLKPEERNLIRSDIERIHEMTDELGQRALLDSVSDLETFKSRENNYERSIWAFINEAENFRRAEGIRYSDHYRQGRMWSGFSVPEKSLIQTGPDVTKNFEIEVKAHFDTGKHVLAEVFKRTRPDMDGNEKDVYQIMLYREDLPKSELIFNEKHRLDRKTWCPVYESAITYEPETGAVDVVARGKNDREELAAIFTSSFMGQKVTADKIPLRSYNLEKLLKPFAFDTDPEDRIEEVIVTLIKLKPYDSKRAVELTIPLDDDKVIHEVAEEWFDKNTPFRNGFYVQKAKISIRFEAEEGERRGRVIPFTISCPNGCNLKSRTEKEQLIADKYLKRWGLIDEVEA